VKSVAGLYIDGFNLYHSILNLGEPHLKWLNLRKLGELIIDSSGEELGPVTFCTAFYPGDSQKRWRHEEYLNALRVVKVEPIMGHYIHEPMECFKCNHVWERPTEKASDVNLALHLFNDARLDLYQTAYLLTADSDQAATAKMFRACFPNKRFITVSPPGRNISHNILAYSHGKVSLKKEHLEKSLFPPIVFAEGMRAGRRPREYDPPAGWTAPT
jgi:hypothetical protein